MPTATLIDANYGGCPGPAHLYELSEPLAENRRELVGGQWVTLTHTRVIVWVQPAFGSMSPCVKVVPLRTTEAPALNVEMPGSYILQHEVSIDEAAWWALMTAGGYEIVVPDPVVDDSPAEFDEPTTLEPHAPEKAEPEVAEVIRVHELAKELGITSADLLAKLAEYGSTITNASANVDHDTAQIMRGIYAEGES